MLTLAAVSSADEVFDARGFHRNRDFFSELPFEHIDPLTGNLLLTFTDLVLPGNAGFDLRIQRTYNSKIYRDYETRGDTLDEDSWAGVGWTLHLGRVFNPYSTSAAPPVIEMPDGSRHRTYRHIDGSGRFITRDFWVYDRNDSTLRLPNGMTYSFGHVASTSTALGDALYATEIRDPFGNRILIEYNPGLPGDGISRIRQILAMSDQRIIDFTYANNALRTMTYHGRRDYTWTYVQTTATGVFTLLNEVVPPVGPSWRYGYNTSQYPLFELNRVTTPQGGVIQYSYQDQIFYIGSTVPIRSRVVRTRTTSGRDIPGGTWSYAYAQGTGKNETVISAPCSTSSYRFLGVGNHTSALPVWQIGLTERTAISEGSTALEVEEIAWIASELISHDTELVGRNQDVGIRVPLVERRTITRGGRSYVTSNTYRSSNFNDYGRPHRTTESGELSRTTTRVFKYGFVPYIVDRLESEAVSVGGETFSRTWTYNLNTGFQLSETTYGIRTEYTPTSEGNVGTVTDANGNRTRYSYRWGVAQSVETPEYTITRSIYPEGMIASETRRGFVTRFEYDDLFRIREKTPPLGNRVLTDYNNFAGSYVRVRRGGSDVITHLDGFGRISATQNSVGVKTDVSYDACGRVVYESYPFHSANIGTIFEHDALDRIERKSNPDGSTVRYDYNGIDVTVTNERNITTSQNWSAFGRPDDRRFVSMTDGEGRTWSYSYNALGNLTGVDPPGSGGEREWSYDSRNLLQWELHPESGRTEYTYYSAGNRKTQRDEEFGLTTFTYDGNLRLTRIDRPGSAYDTVITWDASDNRRSIENAYVRSTFDFDGANRLTSRTDVVNGVTFRTVYTPDGNDNIERIDYPSGQSVLYEYDSENRISTVREPGASGKKFAQQFSYHPSGAVASFRAGNGLVHSFNYDNRYRVDLVNQGSVLNLNYGYDATGNVRSVEDARSGLSQAFAYDRVDRIEESTGPWGVARFTYDDLGNRTTKRVGGSLTSYSFQSSTQRLVGANGAEPASFDYDRNGNLRSAGGASATYTPENMMETFSAGAGTTVYRYDGDNLRKQKIGPDGSRFYVHGPGDLLLSEIEELCPGELAVARDYIYAGSRLIAAVRPVSAAASLSLAVSSMAIAEANGSAVLGVRLATTNGGPSRCTAEVSYATVAETAMPGVDYSETSGKLIFPAGSPSGSTRHIVVPVAADSLDELDESFRVALSSFTGASPGEVTATTVTIVDDDPPPSLSMGDCSVTEGNVSCAFTVSLSAASGLPVSVAYGTANGTAVAGADYGAGSGTLQFAPGDLSRTVTVSILEDQLDENDETFALNLSGPVNATLGDAQGIGRIVDDDPTPSLSVRDTMVTDGNSGTVFAVFKVVLSAVSGRPVTVSYATADGSAASGSDYTATSGVLSFSPGAAVMRVSVPVRSDSVVEGGETFLLRLITPVNATIADGEAVAVIHDQRSPRGDFNSDLKVDVLWYHAEGTDIRVSYMDGARVDDWVSPEPSQIGDANVRIVGTDDFNRDGKTDVVMQDGIDGDVMVIYLDGVRRTGTSPMSPSNVGDPNWNVVSTGDFNRDGKVDLLWQHELSGDVGVAYMDGTTITGSALMEPGNVGDVNWRVVSTGDFNRDGKIDLLWQHQVSMDVAVTYMDGVRISAASLTDPANVGDPSWRIVGTGDYDRNGKVDIVWQHAPSGDTAVSFMDGVRAVGWSWTVAGNVGGTSWKVVGPR